MKMYMLSFQSKLLYSVFLSLSTFFVLNTIDAQKIEETNNIRIDPEWVETNESQGFIWAHDVIVDDEGNSYTTGYFRVGLYETKKNLMIPKCRAGNNCSDYVFLAKRDSSGQLLWLRYVIGNSRPTNLIIDNNGLINMVGTMYSKQVSFTYSTDSLMHLYNHNYEKQLSVIFICQYNKNGEPVKSKILSEKRYEQGYTFNIDQSDNIYIGGSYIYYNYANRRETQPRYLLKKFDKNWNFIWEQSSDTLGVSMISAINFDAKNEVYISGYYVGTMNIETQQFGNQNNRNTKPFMAKLSTDGQLSWFTDSVSTYHSGIVKKSIVDSDGNAYALINTSANIGYISKINKTGNLLWSLKVAGSLKFSDIIMDNENGVYLSGAGSRGLFATTGVNRYAFNNKGSSDFFIVKYDTNGNLLWLKAGGGKRTDYCESIVLYQNKLMAFGFSSGFMSFDKTTINSKRNFFWQGRFDLEKLAIMDDTPEPIIEPKKPFNPLSCTCEQKVESLSYVPSIDDLTELETVEQFTYGWQIVGENHPYDNLFYKNMYQQNNRYSESYALTLLGFEPIRLRHPDGTFTINITPCKSNLNYFELPTHFHYELPVSRSVNNFDYEDFDYTVQSYFDILAITNYGMDEQLLYHTLFRYNTEDLSVWLKKVNQRYEINIVIEDEDEETFSRRMLGILRQNRINLYQFIVDEFIRTKKGDYPIVETEKRRIETFFSINDFESLSSFIQPQIDILFKTNLVGILIDSKVIRQWNGLKNQPKVDSLSNFVSPIILGSTNNVNFSTKDGLKTHLNEICFSYAEISGTGVLFDFSNANLITKPTAKYLYFGGKEQIFDTFTGLQIKNGEFSIPIEEERIVAKGLDVFVNDKGIFGTLDIPLVEMNKKKVTISTKTGELTIPKKDLEKSLKSLGFDQVELEQFVNHFRMKFVKVVD